MGMDRRWVSGAMLELLLRGAVIAALLITCVCGGSGADPTAAPECALMPDPGSCKGFFRRFYYNRWTGKCAMFIYGGCKGVVPFRLHQECVDAKCYLMFPGAQQGAIYERDLAVDAGSGAEFHTVSVSARTTIQ